MKHFVDVKTTSCRIWVPPSLAMPRVVPFFPTLFFPSCVVVFSGGWRRVRDLQGFATLMDRLCPSPVEDFRLLLAYLSITARSCWFCCVDVFCSSASF